MIHRVPYLVCKAVESWLAWRRLKRWQREKGIDTLTTRIKVKSNRHEATKRDRAELGQIVHADIASELGLEWPPARPAPQAKHDQLAKETGWEARDAQAQQ